MLDPTKKNVEVACSAEDAFKIFVNQVSTWWPLDKNSVSAMHGAVAKSVVIEPEMDGKVYEVGHDDTVHTWGKVTAYEPGKLLKLDWHIGVPAENASSVEVRFTALNDNKTRVELTHGRWEAFGEKAADMRSGYDQGWVGVFEQAFVNACPT